MKGTWKIFEFDQFDVLVAKSFSESNQLYALDFSICPEIGNTATVSVTIGSIDKLNESFEAQTPESVLKFADYIIDSLGGHGIFDNGGPDEIVLGVNHKIAVS